MLPTPNDLTALCLNTNCPKRESCWRYVRGGEITVAEYSNHRWLQTCDSHDKYIFLQTKETTLTPKDE